MNSTVVFLGSRNLWPIFLTIIPVELGRVDVKLDVDVDRDQPRDLREYPVVERRDVEHVVVVLVRVGDAQLRKKKRLLKNYHLRFA